MHAVLIGRGAALEAARERIGYTPLTRRFGRAISDVVAMLRQAGSRVSAGEILGEPAFSDCLRVSSRARVRILVVTR